MILSGRALQFKRSIFQQENDPKPTAKKHTEIVSRQQGECCVVVKSKQKPQSYGEFVAGLEKGCSHLIPMQPDRGLE